MKRSTPVVLAILLTGGASQHVFAQVSGSIKVWEGNVLLSPGQSSQAFTYNCEFPIWPLREIPAIGGFSWQLSGNSNGNFSVSANAEFATTPEKIAQNAIEEGFGQVIPDLPCTFGIEEDLGVFRGSFNLYSFSVGGGISGGFEVKRRALGKIDFVDYLDITSPIATTIEMPMHISGSVLAAESFGDPDRTKAIAKLSLSGSLGQEGFIEQVQVESTSVIPDEASINVTRYIPVQLQPGVWKSW